LFEPYLALPPAVTYGPSSYSNAFGANDHLLDSPLDLAAFNSYDFTPSSLTSASSCFGGSDGSPMMVGYGTPELGEGERPLFGGEDVGGSVSPAMLSLDAFPFGNDYAPAPLVAPVPAPAPKAKAVVKKARATKRKQKEDSDDEDFEEERETKKVAKDRFTGTRNTKIAPIGISAPTMSR
jgi:hypothetical protein